MLQVRQSNDGTGGGRFLKSNGVNDTRYRFRYSSSEKKFPRFFFGIIILWVAYSLSPKTRCK